MSRFINLLNDLLQNDDEDLMIIVDDENHVWFYADQVAKLFDNANSEDSVINFVKSKDKTTFDKIRKYAKVHYDIPNHSCFINETGVFDIALSSNKDKAVRFKEWLTEEVVTNIRETGKFELEDNEKEKIEKISEKLYSHKKHIKISEKFPEGYVYIVQPININLDDLHRIDMMKHHPTALPTKVLIKYKSKKISLPKSIELCAKAFLDKFRYEKDSDYYILNLSDMIMVTNKCAEIMEKYNNNQTTNTNDNPNRKTQIIAARPNESDYGIYQFITPEKT